MHVDLTSTNSKTAIVTAADWMYFQQLPDDQKDDWLEERWGEFFDAAHREFGATFRTVPFDQNHSHRTGCCDPDQGCCDDSFSALVEACNDDQPQQWEIEANVAAPLVDICEYVGVGPDAVEQIVTVEATPTWPAFRLVS